MHESGKNRLRNGVAVIVAVCFSTSPTFQAFESSSLCAQDLCKLLVDCEFLEHGWQSPTCLLISEI